MIRYRDFEASTGQDDTATYLRSPDGTKTLGIDNNGYIFQNGNRIKFTNIVTISDLNNRMIFEFVPIMTDDDVKAYYNALPINTIRCDYNYNGKEYTYIFSKSTDKNGNVMRIASSGGTLETRSITNGTWSEWIAK